jgi:hypothetical protein
MIDKIDASVNSMIKKAKENFEKDIDEIKTILKTLNIKNHNVDFDRKSTFYSFNLSQTISSVFWHWPFHKKSVSKECLLGTLQNINNRPIVRIDGLF